jgi:hypothetical protein
MPSKTVCLLALLTCVPLAGAQIALAATDIRAERVEFAPGQSGATLEGKIRGREIVDYLVAARAGQTMTVNMETGHGANYFNVIPPDADSEAVFIGSTAGNVYEGRLDLDGDWKIRVYLMRSAARRNETAAYKLDIGVSGEPDPGAARAANDFGPREWDARGQVGCARGGQPMQTAACPFKVIRYSGSATIFVLAPATGAQRILFFNDGAWSTDGTEKVNAAKREDLWMLIVSGEAYEVPDAVIFGG